MARYGQSFKDRAVARLLPPESAALELVAQEVCGGAATGRGHHGGAAGERQKRLVP